MRHSGSRMRAASRARSRDAVLARRGALPRVTVRSRSMLGQDVPMLATTFLQAHKNELTALLTVVGTIVLAIAVDRALLHRGHRLATAVVRDELTPVIDTRLRFLRRLITLAIVVVG